MHWPLETVLDMEHHDRRQWADEVSAINRKLNGDQEEEPWKPWIPDFPGLSP